MKHINMLVNVRGRHNFRDLWKPSEYSSIALLLAHDPSKMTGKVFSASSIFPFVSLSPSTLSTFFLSYPFYLSVLLLFLAPFFPSLHIIRVPTSLFFHCPAHIYQSAFLLCSISIPFICPPYDIVSYRIISYVSVL